MQQKLNAWHLHLLDATGDSVLYCEWSEDKNPTLGESASVPSDRPYGVLCHGRDLAEVAAKLLNFEAITLGGLFRYRSPEFSDNLEDLRGYVLQPLHWLFDE